MVARFDHGIRVEHGDCREIIPTLGVMVDAVVTDPPYHLIPTQKRFGAVNSAPAQYGRDGAMARLSSGFMSQQWDGGDIAFQPETWATIGSVLRPGGFLLAFGGTRTYHRLACAIEDAGFVIQDCLMWLFATGFPKRKDALKPAYEPLVCAYKPGGKRTLQVDECRIHGSDAVDRVRHGGGIDGTWAEFTTSTADDKHPLPDGRWPANICHDGSDEVVALFPQSAGAVSNGSKGSGLQETDTFKMRQRPQTPGFCDTGSAARFFFSAKAGAQDRWGSRHPTVKPVELLKWLVPLVTPPGGFVLDPFAGSGTTAVAAMATGRNCILIEREDQYIADIKERLAFYEGGGMHSSAAKNRNRKRDEGPLFGGDAA
jgi:site-specific DNA-methyltransferase (adenine-specific)